MPRDPRHVNRARRRDTSVAKVADDLGIGESCLRRWTSMDDAEPGARRG
jgi:transposase-like protein